MPPYTQCSLIKSAKTCSTTSPIFALLRAPNPRSTSIRLLHPLSRTPFAGTARPSGRDRHARPTSDLEERSIAAVPRLRGTRIVAFLPVLVGPARRHAPRLHRRNGPTYRSHRASASGVRASIAGGEGPVGRPEAHPVPLPPDCSSRGGCHLPTTSGNDEAVRHAPAQLRTLGERMLLREENTREAPAYRTRCLYNTMIDLGVYADQRARPLTAPRKGLPIFLANISKKQILRPRFSASFVAPSCVTVVAKFFHH